MKSIVLFRVYTYILLRMFHFFLSVDINTLESIFLKLDFVLQHILSFNLSFFEHNFCGRT